MTLWLPLQLTALTLLLTVPAVTAGATTVCCTTCTQDCNPAGTETTEAGLFITTQPPIPGADCACSCKPNWEGPLLCDVFTPCEPASSPPTCNEEGGTLGPNEDGSACVCTCNEGYSGDDCSVPPTPCDTNPPPCDTTGGTLELNDDETACVCTCNEGFSGDDCSNTCSLPDGLCVSDFGIKFCKKLPFLFLDTTSNAACQDNRQCCRFKRACDQLGETCQSRGACRRRGGTAQLDAFCPIRRQVCCGDVPQ